MAVGQGTSGVCHNNILLLRGGGCLHREGQRRRTAVASLLLSSPKQFSSSPNAPSTTWQTKAKQLTALLLKCSIA